MKYNLIEITMGFLVLLAAISFLVFGINTNKLDSNKEMLISAVFEDSTGLKIGNEVKISGVNVGRIEDLKLLRESFEAKAIISIDKSINLPEDSSARITSSGLLGNNYIEITPGVSNVTLKESDIIFDTTGLVSFTDLLGKMKIFIDENLNNFIYIFYFIFKPILL